jgi:hypothetical protein
MSRQERLAERQVMQGTAMVPAFGAVRGLPGQRHPGMVVLARKRPGQGVLRHRQTGIGFPLPETDARGGQTGRGCAVRWKGPLAFLSGGRTGRRTGW